MSWVCLLGDAPFEFCDDGVEGVDEQQVTGDDHSGIDVVEAPDDFSAIAFVFDEFGWYVEDVVLSAEGLQMAKGRGPAPHKIVSSSEQVAGAAHVSWIGISQGEEIGFEQIGNLAGVDAVILHLPAVDGFHVVSNGRD